MWIRLLVARLGAAIGATRVAVEDSCVQLGGRIQIRNTRSTISPKLYIAFGISGSDHHMVGIGSSRPIMVINKDIDVPIPASSDYAILSDISKL